MQNSNLILYPTAIHGSESLASLRSLESSVPVRSRRRIAVCVALVYYFSFCDFILKFFPSAIATVLRYAPESALYVFALWICLKSRRLISFPLFVPLLACAASMMLTWISNSVSLVAMLSDYRLFWRFVPFALILWNTRLDQKAVHMLTKGILMLAVLQVAIAGLELAGGKPVQEFFAPALNWSSGTPEIRSNLLRSDVGWIAGTLSNYNHFGAVMVLSFILALDNYLQRRTASLFLVTIATASSVVISLSRHSIIASSVISAILLALSRRAAIRLIAPVVLLIALFAGLASSGLAGQLGLKVGERLQTLGDRRVLSGDPAMNVRLFMIKELPVRFIRTSPFFGEGPVGSESSVQDQSRFGGLEATIGLPDYATHFLADVQWLTVFGLYGGVGLAMFALVFIDIAWMANRLRLRALTGYDLMLAHVCLMCVAFVCFSGFFSQEIIARDTIPMFWLIVGAMLSRLTQVTTEYRPTEEAS